MTDQNLILQGLRRLSLDGYRVSEDALELDPGCSLEERLEGVRHLSVSQKILLLDDMRQYIVETERQIALLQQALGAGSGS